MPLSNPITVQGIYWKGDWSSVTNYLTNDAISRTGSSYICVTAHSNQAPPNTTYWNVLSQSGVAGPSGADGAAGAQGAQGAQGPQGVGTGISLTGWQIIVSPADIFGWMTSVGSTTGNAAVPVYYNSTNTTGDVIAFGFASSAVDAVQSRYAFATFINPPYTSGFGASGIRVRMLSSSTVTGNSTVSMRIADATGAIVTISDMVSPAALAVQNYSVSGASLMPFNHDIYTVRFDFRAMSGHTGAICGVEAHYI